MRKIRWAAVLVFVSGVFAAATARENFNVVEDSGRGGAGYASVRDDDNGNARACRLFGRHLSRAETAEDAAALRDRLVERACFEPITPADVADPSASRATLLDVYACCGDWSQCDGWWRQSACGACGGCQYSGVCATC